MANKHTLHKSRIKAFAEWLIYDGWQLEKTKGEYEVLRAVKKGKKPLIIYKTIKQNHEHYTYADEFSGIIKQFTKEDHLPVLCRGCKHFNAKLLKCRAHDVLVKEITMNQCMGYDYMKAEKEVIDLIEDINIMHLCMFDGDPQYDR